MDLMARIAAAKAAQAAKQAQGKPNEEESRPQISTTPENRAEVEQICTAPAEPAAAPAEPEAQNSEKGPETTAPPRPVGGLTLPKRPAGLKPIGAKPLLPPKPAAPVSLPDHPEPAPANSAAPTAPAAKPSMLATLTARRDAEKLSSKSEITTAGQAAVLAGPSYSPQEFLDEWNTLEAQDEENVTIDDRAELLRKACRRIAELYEQEMEALKTEAANDMSMMELSQLVKLAFMRVKDSPAAWAMIDREDKSKVIKGIIAMAQKRNSAVKGRKPKDAAALSSSFAGAADIEDAGADELANLMGSMDFGGFM